MKEFWNFIQMVFMAVGGWLPGHLQEGADLSAGGDGEYSGCVCDRKRICAEDSGDLFLYFQ